MASETFNSSTTWTCPAGVTSVQAECYGGGGGPTGTNGGDGRVVLTYTVSSSSRGTIVIVSSSLSIMGIG